MMLPLLLLYEFGIFLSVGVYRRREKAEEEYEASLEPPAGSVERT
jgi:Sec-independent protein secretion pathway component TatC